MCPSRVETWVPTAPNYIIIEGKELNLCNPHLYNRVFKKLKGQAKGSTFDLEL